jgi:hypothetical protein
MVGQRILLTAEFAEGGRDEAMRKLDIHAVFSASFAISAVKSITDFAER